MEPPSFGKAGEVAAVGVGDRAQGLRQSLDAAEPPQRTSFKGTVVPEPQVVQKARSKVLVATEPSCDLGDQHEEAEEGELRAWVLLCEQVAASFRLAFSQPMGD